MHEEITEKIIGSAYTVHNEMGFGFIEKVYQNALKMELEKTGLKVEAEKPIKVHCKGAEVGDYAADLIVEDKVIVELKAVKNINEAHEVQLVNYLKATDVKIGLLINFGEKVEVRRRVFDESRNRIRENPRKSASKEGKERIFRHGFTQINADKKGF